MFKKFSASKLILILSLVAIIVLLCTQVIPRVAAWSSKSKSLAKSAPQKIGGMKSEVSASLSATNNPRISMTDGREVITQYVGASKAVETLQNNQAEPLALIADDIDSDGVKDLIAAYAGNTGGILAFQKGNRDYLYPNAPETRKHKEAGEFTDAPFLAEARVLEITEKPDFIGAGDFNRDGNSDLVVASRQDNVLLFLLGDGKGNFSTGDRITLPGFVTALRVGDVNRRDGLQDIVVAVWGGEGAKAMVFESPEGAIKAKPEIFALPAQAIDLLLENVDGDFPVDITVAAGNDLLIISGRDRKLSLSDSQQAQVEAAKITRQHFRTNIRSLAFGDFNAEQGRELAMLTDDGSITIIARTAGEGANAIYTSRILETGAFPTATQLICSRVSDEARNNLAVLDGVARQLHLISSGVKKNTRKQSKENLTYDAEAVAELNLSDVPVAVLPMRLNADPLSDFVFLRRGQSAITVAPSAPKAIFTVTNTNDDNNTGSLRRAINDANGSFGFDEIDFNIPEGGQQTINLTSALPDLQAIFINGTSQPGYSGQPIIAINGSGAGSITAGLVLATSGEIQGVVVQNIQGSSPNGNGIQLTSGVGEATVHNCYIGTDFAGAASAGNGGYGLDIEGSNTIIIGGGSFSDQNLISGNASDGVHVASGADGVAILNCFIGTNLSGNAAIANGGAGIRITASTNNMVDGTNGFNLISGNSGDGVKIDSSATGNIVQGNRIGVSSSGSADLGNSLTGVLINSSNGNTVGGIQFGQRNLISGNNTSGIIINASMNTQVQSNLIGTDVEGNVAIGNTNYGVLINGGSSNNTIGGNPFGTGNLISGNGNGMQIGEAGSAANNNFVQQNKIGTNGIGSVAIPNSGFGVGIVDSANNAIGGSGGQGNLISGNGTFGILISTQTTTATTNTVLGNFVGVDTFLASALPNGSDGLRVDNATNNQIGDTSGNFNVFSGNTGAGVSLVNGASGNILEGNYIGIVIPSANATRRVSSVVPNANGVIIQNSPNNHIGGTTAGARNFISGNTSTGLSISGASATGNMVQGNYIGLDDTGASAGNGNDGVTIGASAANNTIGGTAANAGNVISGNGSDGIFIANASNNSVQGNLIGTNSGGTSAIANPNGIILFFGATNNTIGGTTAAARNVISGNSGNGILMQGTGVTGNLVQGNYIGTDFTGLVALANSTGITIDQGASTNTIGGTSAGARNIISGNSGNGILIQSTGTTGNAVQGNYIGLKADGSGALPNANGVFIQAGTTGNTVGGTASGSGNVISGNSSFGVSINGSDVSGNLIQGNLIGTDPTGATAIGNSIGAQISSSTNNTIGGTSAATRNIISGNTSVGISIFGGNANLIQGNFIGTNAAGSAALANGSSGVTLSASDNNAIGGVAAGSGNLISGNGSHGIEIGDGKSNPSNNSVRGNLIGTNLTGTAAIANGGSGILLSAATNTTIGGTTSNERNIISGNTSNGISLIFSTNSTLIQGNFMGTNAAGTSAIANGVDGIAFNFNANNNTIGGTTAGTSNIIAFNTGRGVNVISGTGNQILGNSIFSNGSLGIDLGNDGVTANDSGDGDTGPNNLQNFPVLTTISSGGGSIMISGTLNSNANSNFRIEFFLNTSCDGSGNGEGQTFLGFTNVTTDGSGNVTFNATVPGSIPSGNVVTATATDSAGNTSEFSQCQGAVAADADLSVTKTDSPDPVLAGNNITYTVTVNNAGPVAATNASLTDTVPANTTFQSINAPVGWSVTAPPIGGTGTITATNPSVAVSSPQVFTIVVKVNASTADGTVITNTANITSSTNDPNPNNNSATATTTVNVQADLAITLADAPDPVLAGGNITYTVTVTNNGPSNAANLSLSESTPANTTFQSLNAPAGWNCSTPPVNGTGNITCTNPNLAPATPQVFTLVVQVNIGTPNGTVINDSASVSSTTPDPNSANNSASTTTTVNNTCSITCPANITVSTAPNQCSAVVTYPAPTVNGTCGTVNCSPASGSTFPKGTTSVSCTTQSGPSCTFTVTVNDTQAPTITCPGNISVIESPPGSGMAQVNYAAPTVSDNCTGVGSPSCNPPSGSLFSVGTTTVNCTVSDSSSNSANCSFQVTVSNACAISCPATITVNSAANQCGATVDYPTPTVTGNCGTVTCKPSSGSVFVVGTTRVNCTTTQGPSCSFNVVVVDRTLPQISCPSNVTVAATGGAGTIVNYPSPTISDNCSGVRSFCTPASGTAFPVGTTTVNCTASDNAGNARSCSFTVTVTPDNQPPTITCPQNVTVTAATGETSAVVTYPAPVVTDNNPGATAVCVPPSGSTFAVGTTPVTCTATDVGGNQAFCTFSVMVQGGPPQGQVSIPGGKSNVEFPTSPARRKPKAGPCSNFSITNTGQTPLVLTFESILRTGADVTNGRITDPNEGDLYRLSRFNSNGVEVDVLLGSRVTIGVGETANFCARFVPVLPRIATSSTGLAAPFVVADVITSKVTLRLSSGSALVIPLLANVSTDFSFINPNNPKKAPQATFVRQGDNYILTYSIFDSNQDVKNSRVELLDGSGSTVATFDVDLLQPLRDRNLVRGQSFTVEQRFTGANANPQVTSARVTVMDGTSSATLTADISSSGTALRINGSDAGAVVALPPLRIRK